MLDRWVVECSIAFAAGVIFALIFIESPWGLGAAVVFCLVILGLMFCPASWITWLVSRRKKK